MTTMGEFIFAKYASSADIRSIEFVCETGDPSSPLLQRASLRDAGRTCVVEIDGWEEPHDIAACATLRAFAESAGWSQSQGASLPS
jgi:hypothetical protein